MPCTSSPESWSEPVCSSRLSWQSAPTEWRVPAAERISVRVCLLQLASILQILSLATVITDDSQIDRAFFSSQNKQSYVWREAKAAVESSALFRRHDVSRYQHIGEDIGKIRQKRHVINLTEIHRHKAEEITWRHNLRHLLPHCVVGWLWCGASVYVAKFFL